WEQIMAQSRVLAGPEVSHAPPAVRRIGLSDLKDALARGIDDFKAMPSHAVFLCLIYPIVGVLLGAMLFGSGVMWLVYPLVAGFPLLGPFAAIGLFGISRRREGGGPAGQTPRFDWVPLSSFGGNAGPGAPRTAIFALWLAVAHAIYVAHFGYGAIESIREFAHRVFTTREGWSLMLVGNAVGFLFALLVLTISVVSFPLLLDRDVGVVEAVLTS